jgi:hypothetical protein
LIQRHGRDADVTSYAIATASAFSRTRQFDVT